MKKCPKCKILSAPTASRCDCGYVFPSETVRTPQATAESETKEPPRHLSPPPAMGTINGWGTFFWGWRHSLDGTATVTRWFTAFWLPIIPLSRHQLRVLTSFGHDDPVVRSAAFVGQRTVYQYLAQSPLSMREVAITLLRAYLGLPLILVGPLLLAAAIVFITEKVAPSPGKSGETGAAILTAITMLSLVNFIWQCVLALRAGRGWHPDALAKVDPVRWCLRRVARPFVGGSGP